MDLNTAARQRLEFARGYTRRLLDQTPREDWSRMPPAGVSHIAWQIGHLAMAEYRLALQRIRPRTAADADLMSDDFLAAFGKGSAPALTLPLPLEVIEQAFYQVHEQVLRELPGWSDAELAEPLLLPHAIARTKREALEWCANHELIHAGQIALLRRQLGHAPIW